MGSGAELLIGPGQDSLKMVGGKDRPVLKLKDMEEKQLHNLFLKNMSGLIEEVKNPTPRLNPNSKCGGMATHAGLAIELGITRKKSLSPQMEAILIWCQCRTREYDNVNICDFTQSWSNGLAFCALIHNFFPNAFDYNALKVDSPRDRLKNYEVAFVTGEKFAGVPDFLTAEDMSVHGGGEQNRPQDDLLLRAGGLQDVQRALVGKTFSHSSFQGAKSRLLSAGCFLGKPYMRFDRSIRS